MGTVKRILADQLGYRPQDRKWFMTVGRGGAFTVEDERGHAVYRGEMTRVAAHDEASGAEVWRGDFTPVTAAGRYRIRLEAAGDGESVAPECPVVIGDDVYRDVHRALLKAFYFFRCGMALTEPHAGPWTHGACHTAQARVYGENRMRDASGGWHDAGDYGKYTVPGAKAVADLLLAYELNPHAFGDATGIPESGNGVPDVLDECRYELEFLLRMQDEATGGAFHKVTTEKFPSLYCRPEDDTEPLVFSPVSATATGSLAAVAAMAARVWRDLDAAFAARCLEAAERAWRWLADHPEVPGFRNPPEITTGEYGDKCDLDERYWAAAELMRTTGKPVYREAVIRLLERGGFDPCEFGWADVGGYGTVACLLADPAVTGAELRARLRGTFLARARKLQDLAGRDGFAVALRPEDYIWGSNMVVMNRAMHLLIAAREEGGDPAFREAALEQLHYIFGRNVLGQCYVSGFGTRPLLHPHYRPGCADGIDAPVPGMLSGGPNRNLQDDYAAKHLAGRSPAACHADHEDSYSTNEVAIYWNSPAVLVTSFFVREA